MKRPKIVGFTLAIILAALPWAMGADGRAGASHPHAQNDGQHIVGLHYSSYGHSLWDEDYCTESYTNTFTDYEIQVKVTTLIYGQGWDGMGDWKVDNYPTAYNCETYWPDIAWVEYRISVLDDTWSVGCEGYSCVNFEYPRWINGVLRDHFQGRVWLKTSHVNPLSSQSANATINHEMGHVYGLLDGGGAECGISIMHQFGYCGYGTDGPYQQWPAQVDKDSVVNNIMPIHW